MKAEAIWPRARAEWERVTAPPWGPYGVAVALAAAATAAAELLYRFLGLTRLSSVFLTAVLLTAVWFGRRPAFLAAALAFSIYNFYLVEPRFSIALGSAEDVLTLLIFLIVALLTGGLAGRLSEEVRRSRARARTLDALLGATREFSSISEAGELKRRLAAHVATAAGSEAAVLDQTTAWRSIADGAETAEAVAPGDREALRRSGWSVRPLSAAGPRGEVWWRGERVEVQGDEEAVDLIEVLAQGGDAALARIQLASEKAQAEAVARTEHLRTTLLASVSHDLRTPLTAILTSAASLLQFDDSFTRETRADLVTTIQEEAERLSLYVGNLLNMTRLEAGALAVDLSTIPLTEVLERLIARFSKRSGGASFALTAKGEFSAAADGVLLEQALSNVIENAVRYSPPKSPVAFSLSNEGAAVVIEISDEGPGAPPEELELMFERFFSSPRGAAAARGTGLGLPIARGLIEAMGGTIVARQRTDRRGLSVVVRLPRAEQAL